MLAVAGLAAASLPAASAHAAPPNPFGHPCVPQAGVLFCPTAGDDQRVASWDGVPLDVDVTLPPGGDGPFPTIVMMHGWGGSKGSFESLSPTGSYNTAGSALPTSATRGATLSTSSACSWTRGSRAPTRSA